MTANYTAEELNLATGEATMTPESKIRKAFAAAIKAAKKSGVDLAEGPCECGHSQEQHAYTPRCGGSIACTVCTCNSYSEKQ